MGLLMAPKPGQELYQDIVDGCNSINAKGCELSKNIRDKSHSLMHPFERQEEESTGRSFLVGGAIGTVIAALAALMLAPQSGDKLRGSLGHSYDDIRKKAERFVTDLNSKGNHAVEEIGDWKDALLDIVNKLSKGKHTNSHLNEILEYATLGLQLFQQLKNRK